MLNLPVAADVRYATTSTPEQVCLTIDGTTTVCNNNVGKLDGDVTTTGRHLLEVCQQCHTTLINDAATDPTLPVTNPKPARPTTTSHLGVGGGSWNVPNHTKIQRHDDPTPLFVTQQHVLPADLNRPLRQLQDTLELRQHTTNQPEDAAPQGQLADDINTTIRTTTAQLDPDQRRQLLEAANTWGTPDDVELLNHLFDHHPHTTNDSGDTQPDDSDLLQQALQTPVSHMHTAGRRPQGPTIRP